MASYWWRSDPADDPSRGISTNDIINSECWWFGPTFLRDIAESNFQDHESVDASEHSERRKTAFSVSKNSFEDCPLITRFSSYTRLIRVLAWMLRFISKIRPKVTRKPSPTSLHLLASEVKNTEFLCIRFKNFIFLENLRIFLTTGLCIRKITCWNLIHS